MLVPLHVTVPSVNGPLPVTDGSHPFSDMAHARVPLDLAALGYVEEEYLLVGEARVFEDSPDGARERGDSQPWCTRVIVRRPVDGPVKNVWLSVLNASQGYDIEDDWRRAWDYVIGHGDTYAGISSKPVQAASLRIFDPERYAALSWGGPVPPITMGEDWNPFLTIPECEEGLVWEMLAQTSAWLRSGSSLGPARRVYLMGQSQSGVYTNTFLTYFHDLLRVGGGAPAFDGYLPGVSTVYCKELNQSRKGTGQAIEAPGTGRKKDAFVPRLVTPGDIDVPVITVSSEADTRLFAAAPEHFNLGDGPMRRHWHVERGPHSDARSRVIPADDEVRRAGRAPRVMDQQFLERLSVLPLEPVITGAMAAMVRWVEDGRPAAPSIWFETDNDGFVRDEAGNLRGGVRLGLLEHPLADFFAGAPESAVYGAMTLHSTDDVQARYADREAYKAACDRVDAELEDAGYIDDTGRRLLSKIEDELWDRVVLGQAAPLATPQGVGN